MRVTLNRCRLNLTLFMTLLIIPTILETIEESMLLGKEEEAGVEVVEEACGRYSRSI